MKRGSNLGDPLGDLFPGKSCFTSEKGPQMVPKKNDQIQKWCVQGGFEVFWNRCVGILSRRRHRFETGWDCQEY